jgi:hypothetical protein
MSGKTAEVLQLVAAGTETSSAGQNMMTIQVPSAATLRFAPAPPAITTCWNLDLLIDAPSLLPFFSVFNALSVPLFGTSEPLICARSEGSWSEREQ